MHLIKKSVFCILAATGLIGACTGDEQNVDPSDPNEVITTATLTLTSQTTPVQSVTAIIDNLNATADVSRSTLNLRANTTYAGVLTLLDKTKTPVLDVSAEVKQEANEHLFVYTYTPATGPAAALQVTITDKDTNPTPYPLGLTTRMQTGATGAGKLTVVLKHQPDTKDGTAAPGTTDLSVDFNVIVQ